METQSPKNGSKELLLAKLSYAVTSSIAAHLLILFAFICITHFHLQPVEWFTSTATTFASFTTWLYLLLFAVIIFAQTVTCAKQYVFTSTWSVSRFHRVLSIFSLRNVVLFALYTTIGGLTVWLHLSLSALDHAHLFVVVSGCWTGAHYYLFRCDTKSIIFPVIQQPKLHHFKGHFLALLKQSRSEAFTPTLYFFLFYYTCGSYLIQRFQALFHVQFDDESIAFAHYSYVYLLAIVYCVNMNLMQFFFELFLTQPVEYGVDAGEQRLSLAAAIDTTNLPIVQHLACLDLYRLSTGSRLRRQRLFALSQPGAHPHNWNALAPKALRILDGFTDALNSALDALMHAQQQQQAKKPAQAPAKPVVDVQSPLQQKFMNMRNMSLMEPTASSPTIITCRTLNLDPNAAIDQIADHTEDYLNRLTLKIKNIALIRYIFGELSQNKVKQCLRGGQLIIWTAQSVANVAVASYDEDQYAVVQKDLCVIATALVKLKWAMDRLNKMPVFSRRGPDFDDFSLKMKNGVNGAVRRSICHVSRRFREHLKDIAVSADVLQQMQCYL